MTSWANRSILRKRNISQIPEEFRPHILPRVNNPQVILSESYQPKIINEIIYPNNENKITKDLISSYQSSIFKDIIKPIQNINPTATELTYQNKSFVFVILRNIRNIKDNNLWISSYNSIRKFYTNKIIIIDDNSMINTVNGKLVNTDIIKSDFNGAGEILPYYYFMNYRWADYMIFLHDSMFLYRPFTLSELDCNVRFHWYFTSNKSDNNNKILDYILFLKNNNELQDYINTENHNWKGCFGVTTIINLSIVDYLENKYSLFSTLVRIIRTRKDRETFERVFGKILFFEKMIDDASCSNFGDIFKYPGAFDSLHLNIETAIHKINETAYNTAIVKIWKGR